MPKRVRRCCSRRRAPASINTATSNIEENTARSWCEIYECPVPSAECRENVREETREEREWDSAPGTRHSTLRETMSRKLTYDTWLFAAALLLIVIGLVMIYSASAIITV